MAKKSIFNFLAEKLLKWVTVTGNLRFLHCFF